MANLRGGYTQASSQPPRQHSSKQRLALAICDFLNASTTDGTLTPDDKASVDVAVSCIAESFRVDPADGAAVADAVGNQSLLQVYEAYDKLKAAAASASAAGGSGAGAGAGAGGAAAAAPEPSSEQKKEAGALKSRGNSAMAQKDYAGAIDLYTQALRIHPANAVFLSNRAAAHSAAKDHAAARLDAEAAVAIDPTYTKAWSRLGLARFALGDPKGAMDAYEQGIRHEGNGGSDAMRKGFETAKRRVDEMQASDDGLARAAAPAATPSPGGLPDLGAGPGGMPDLGSIMSNPMFASMAQNLMSNPDLMSNLMGNPRLRDMANQFTSGGGMPDFSSLLSDPNIADMSVHPRPLPPGPVANEPSRARSMMGGGSNPGSGNNNSNNNHHPAP